MGGRGVFVVLNFYDSVHAADFNAFALYHLLYLRRDLNEYDLMASLAYHSSDLIFLRAHRVATRLRDSWRSFVRLATEIHRG